MAVVVVDELAKPPMTTETVVKSTSSVKSRMSPFPLASTYHFAVAVSRHTLTVHPALCHAGAIRLTPALRPMPLPSHGPPAVSQRRLHSATSLPPPLSTGVHNSLKPLKLAKQRNNNGAVGNDVDGAIGVASLVLEADSEEHVLPGGVGTFSIRQASDAPLREEADSHGIVRGAFLPALHGSRMENTHETSSGSRAHRAQSIMWQDSGIDQKSTATRAEGRSSTSNASQRPSTPRSKHSTTKQ